MKRIKLTKYLIAAVSILLLSCCTSHLSQEYTKANKKIENTLSTAIKNNSTTKSKTIEVPNTIFSALAPQVDLSKQEDEPRFDISAQKQDAAQFFSGLAKGAGISMMVSPELSGNITLDMFDVTLGEILESVRSVYGFEFVKTSYG
ncbi:MAG: hypothetical protein VX335_01910, partial [Pseudomonadota bacterium]|nr:hypothetical protein [Pseudomonadota bacterium]